MRLDPLTQTVTPTAAPAVPKPGQIPAGSIAPTEQVARFVAAADEVTGALAYESAYAAVRLRRRMTGQITGLSALDTRLAGAAMGLRDATLADGTESAPSVEAAERAEARMAELRSAAASLNVAISGARSDVAAVLQQMQAELGAAMEAVSKGSPSTDSGLDGAVAGASAGGEALIRRAKVFGAR